MKKQKMVIAVVKDIPTDWSKKMIIDVSLTVSGTGRDVNNFCDDLKRIRNENNCVFYKSRIKVREDK